MPEKQYVLPVPSKRGVMFFLIANVLAFALCGAVWAFLAEHSGWTVGAALSPLFAALVLGYGYMRRAMARRAREKAEALAEAAKAAGTQLPA